MLARRDYSRALLAQRLAAKGYPAGEVDDACRRCTDLGYLDDRKFGHSRLELRLSRRPAGRRDAVRDLQRQGLTATMSETVVDEVFEALGGEAEVLDRAFDRWATRHGDPDDLATAKRCFDHLMRRSFPRYLILRKLSPWLDDLGG